MAEGAPLLREYAGKNLHPGFESLSLRQNRKARHRRALSLVLVGAVGFGSSARQENWKLSALNWTGVSPISQTAVFASIVMIE